MLNHRLIDHLERSHPVVAEVFRKYENTILKDYSRILFDYDSKKLEPELVQSFQDEWKALGLSKDEIVKASTQLEKNPVLQTGHHITPTLGPTFLALDLISCAGLKENQIYLVGANSGVAFSNTAWTGALSFGSIPMENLLNAEHPKFHKALISAAERKSHGATENRISLIPSSQRDQLVFGSTICSTTIDQYNLLSENLQTIIPKPVASEPYSYWASKTCTGIQKKILQHKQLLIFDVNKVINRYLVQVLSSVQDHPVKRILFESSTRNKIQQIFQNPVMFLGSYKGKKSFKVDPLTWNDEGLTSSKSGIVATTVDELVEGLMNDKYCPGVFLVFLILRFINGLRCLGSFNQLEYMETFRKKWQILDKGWRFNLEPESAFSLTTGRVEIDGKEMWPLDLAVKNETLLIENFLEMKMGSLWEPILQHLTN